MSEHQVQASIVAYLRTVLPRGYRVIAVANKPRSAVQGRLEKQRGALKGCPDLLLVRQDGYTAFLEVKHGKGRLSPEQAEFGEWLVNGGGEFAVIRSIDDARSVLAALNIQTREGRA